MKVLNPNNTTHEIDFIPRYYPIGSLVVNLYNEGKRTAENVANIYVVNDGIATISFDYTFLEGEKFQIKITEGLNVVYRGKITATSQDTQEFKATNNAYYY
jgi:hypothetical protein